jgi:D-lactate dehydrogenase
MLSPKAIDESAPEISRGNIRADLEQLLGKESVLAKLIERLAHAGDASIYRMIPQVVLMPRTDEDIRKILDYCRNRNLPIAFRAAGTSLSGQAVTDGILVSLGRHWRDYSVSEDGRTVTAQPGVVGGKLNAVLSRRGCKIGPDPASINAAMIGGIVANNASGLCCGIDRNSYRTLRGMRLILADGYVLDTSQPDAGPRLERERPQLVRGLLQLRQEVLSQPELAARIRHKYRIKNTTGYSLNALIDFDRPVDILTHLMVGSEGTLGFISQVTLDTIPLPKFQATALAYFRDLRETGESIFQLREIGAAVVEFMDRASLLSVGDRMQYSFDLSPNCAALLVEFQEDDEGLLADKIEQAIRAISSKTLLEPLEFTRDPEFRRRYWSIRKGIYPTVGAMRARGASVLIEDVVFPMHRIPEAIPDLQQLILRSGFPDGVIFGHAKEGNFHPVLTHDFSNERVVRQYADFMNALADLVLNRYDGSFKGEHGTGRNVAPFVEMEWGKQAHQWMYRIKELLDPSGILNPGVILNPDPEVHLKNLKPMPVFSEIADACIECGFCEVRCPSQDITLSPRQRIAVQRQIVELERRGDPQSRQQAKTLEEEYLYYGVDTCAVDGMCAMACP